MSFRSLGAGLPVLVAACLGQIEGKGDPGFPAEGRAPGGRSSPAPVAEPRIDSLHGAIGVRRLTRFEYGNTIADLLGVKGGEAVLADDASVELLSNNQNELEVGFGELEAYERAANRIATNAMGTLQLPAGCTVQAPTGDCVSRFLQDFLLRAFRRPPAGAEVQRYADLFGRLAPDGAQEALRGVLQAVLLAPSFLYRTEIGGDGGALSSWELASRLSYFIWGTMPDAELFQRAKAAELGSRPALETQLRRMLKDPRAQQGILNIMSEWLGLKGALVSRKGADILAGTSSRLQASMEEETRRYIVETLLGGGGSYQALYGSGFSFLNDALAAVYGMKGITNKDLRRMDVDPGTRRGLFTQPLVLTAHTKETGYSVVQMGRFVRERLLCQHIPPPPPNAKTEIEETAETAKLTYRQKLEDHELDTGCAGCHKILDPPGFAYLPYDPIGRFKANDVSGVPYDTKGTLLGLGAGPAPFANATEMLDAIAASQEGMACFARKLTEYAFGRTLAPGDVPLYEKLVWRLEARGDFTALLTDIVASDEFETRGPGEAR